MKVSYNVKNIDRFETRPLRSITVNGVKWKWTIGRGGYLQIYGENGIKIDGYAQWGNVGTVIDDYCRMVEPSDIKAVIEKYEDTIKY